MQWTHGLINFLAPTDRRISMVLGNFQRKNTDKTSHRDLIAQIQSFSTKSKILRCSSRQHLRLTLLLTHTRVSSPIQKLNLFQQKSTTRFLKKSLKKSSGHLSLRKRPGIQSIMLNFIREPNDTTIDPRLKSIMNISQVIGVSKEPLTRIPVNSSKKSEPSCLLRKSRKLCRLLKCSKMKNLLWLSSVLLAKKIIHLASQVSTLQRLKV